MIYQLDNTALMYVATNFVDGTEAKQELSSTKGELLLSKVGEGPSSDEKNPGTRLTFQYRGPKDTVLRSVIFDSNIVKYAKLTKAEQMRIPLKSVKISAVQDDPSTSDAFENLVSPNFDYMLRVSVPQSFSLNPNEVLIKDVVYHSKNGDTTGHVIAGFVYNLVKSQNEYTPWKVFIGSDEVTKEDLKKKSIYEYAEEKKAITDFTIKAVWNPAIEWQLKYKEVQVPEFFVSACILGENADYDIEEGGESDWIKIEKLKEDIKTEGAYVPNGYETANREMWYLVSNGTQNDQDSRLMYRSETMVDPTLEYDYLNMHITENSEHGIASGMNEKDLIIVAPRPKKDNGSLSESCIEGLPTILEAFGIKFKVVLPPEDDDLEE